MKEFVKKHEEILKTIGVILGIILALTALFFVSENTGDRKSDRSDAVQEEEKNPLLEDGQVLNEEEIAEIPEITYEEFKKLLKKKTTTVVMLGYDECYWCQEQKPILGNVMFEKKIENVKYLNVNKLEEDQYNELVGLHKDLESLGTPTFISIKSKKVKKVSPNAKTKTQLIEMFTDMGIIK